MRGGSPRNLQSGEIINKMKFRPLPPPPRPPREKRIRGSRASSEHADEEHNFDDRDGGGERIASSSTADSYDQNGDFEDDELRFAEVEVSTQTDPLPDDFVCEEFEITPDMKVIEPRCLPKTLDELLKEEQQKDSEQAVRQPLSEDEQLARGLQRFRDANQRSVSERSRASSQADRSRSLSRPQTPSSAVIIERRVSTPISSPQEAETLLEASLTVRPIDDLDLEEEELRREGLLTDSSQYSKSDAESNDQADEIESKLVLSDYSQAPSSVELDAALENLRSGTDVESERELETIIKDDASEEISRTLRDLEDFEKDSTSERFTTRSQEEEQSVNLDDIDMQAELEKIRLEEEERADVDQLQREIEKLLQGHEEEYTQHEGTEYNQENEIRTLEEKIVEVIRQDAEHQAQLEVQVSDVESEPAQPPPQPPPRRKSTTNVDVTAQAADLAIVEDSVQTPTTSSGDVTLSKAAELPTHINDLEVQRLRVHALQAGQIMVGQLHGTEISADELECKSGNLVLKNIELPLGFIEDIVERVRTSERAQLLSTETQTSQHNSNEMLPAPLSEVLPPPKPPRQRDLDAARPNAAADGDIACASKQNNLDEETQTDPLAQLTNTSAPPMAVFPSIEYLQSLAPLAFYNLDRQGTGENLDETRRHHRGPQHAVRHHHHHQRKYESSSSELEDGEAPTNNIQAPEDLVRRRHHTRSPTLTAPAEAQSVTQASRQFVTACSFSLVKVINQLTSSLGAGFKEANVMESGDLRLRQTSQQLVLLFAVIAVALLVFMLTGRNVHTHHWDYFNPPGNEGRPS